MDILTGNAQFAKTEGTGWFLGFSAWTRLPGSDLLHVPRKQLLSGLCVKWFDHMAGDASGNDKPISEGRTISILITAASDFRLEFSCASDFPTDGTRIALLRRQGDYVAWGAGLFHRWRCIDHSTILTIRWSPEDEVRSSSPSNAV